jgi:hypothetical protein
VRSATTGGRAPRSRRNSSGSSRRWSRPCGSGSSASSSGCRPSGRPVQHLARSPAWAGPSILSSAGPDRDEHPLLRAAWGRRRAAGGGCGGCGGGGGGGGGGVLTRSMQLGVLTRSTQLGVRLPTCTREASRVWGRGVSVGAGVGCPQGLPPDRHDARVPSPRPPSPPSAPSTARDSPATHNPRGRVSVDINMSEMGFRGAARRQWMRALPEGAGPEGHSWRRCEGFVVEMEWRDSRNLVHLGLCYLRNQRTVHTERRIHPFLRSGLRLS